MDLLRRRDNRSIRRHQSASRAKVFKIFTTPGLLHNATCEVVDAYNGRGAGTKYVPVVKASVETIKKLLILYVGGSFGGSTISVAKSTYWPPPCPDRHEMG